MLVFTEVPRFHWVPDDIVIGMEENVPSYNWNIADDDEAALPDNISELDELEVVYDNLVEDEPNMRHKFEKQVIN